MEVVHVVGRAGALLDFVRRVNYGFGVNAYIGAVVG